MDSVSLYRLPSVRTLFLDSVRIHGHCRTSPSTVRSRLTSIAKILFLWSAARLSLPSQDYSIGPFQIAAVRSNTRVGRYSHRKSRCFAVLPDAFRTSYLENRVKDMSLAESTSSGRPTGFIVENEIALIHGHQRRTMSEEQLASRILNVQV